MDFSVKTAKEGRRGNSAWTQSPRSKASGGIAMPRSTNAVRPGVRAVPTVKNFGRGGSAL
jgi:hypothetical protein